MKTGLRHQEYVKALLEKRKLEKRNIHPFHEIGDSITSPPSAVSFEENRLLTEYMEQKNIQLLSNSMPLLKKHLVLKKFFKMKRSQEVLIYTLKKNEDFAKTSGKVSAIGRDFVMLTNLVERIWIPYKSIKAANIPPGVPTFTNSHQYFLYDNDLKKKLLKSFGKTVSKRDALIQQFYEESLLTNLNSWSGVWVQVSTADYEVIGRIEGTTNKHLLLSNQTEIPWEAVKQISSLRFLKGWYLAGKSMVQKCFSSLS